MDVKNLDINNITLEHVLSDKVIFSALFNILDVHLFAIAKDGSYFVKNKILQEAIDKLYPIEKPEVLNAKDIDPVAWDDCCYVMESGKTKVQEEHAPNGHYYLSVKSPLVHKAEVIGVIGIAIDITKQKQAELAKEEFLANMSHDLRIPFSGILSMADYLYQHETDELKREFLGNIVQSSKSFLDFLSQILELTKSDIGAETAYSSRFNIGEEVNEIVAMFQAELKIKGLTLIVDCPSAIIKTDKLKLAKILLNLLGNAIKFTESGTIQIQVRLNPILTITVKDTGVGISEEHQSRIFDKFYKITPSYKTGMFKGSGLGLYIVQETVKSLGGFISLESKLNQGSSFTVSLPIQQASNHLSLN